LRRNPLIDPVLFVTLWLGLPLANVSKVVGFDTGRIGPVTDSKQGTDEKPGLWGRADRKYISRLVMLAVRRKVYLAVGAIVNIGTNVAGRGIKCPVNSYRPNIEATTSANV
jgi:hypothetical protein